MKLVAIFALWPSLVLAQSLTMQLDSPWAPWASTAVHTVGAQPLRRDLASGNLEAIPGQRVTIGALSFRSLAIKARFPGQKSTPMTVAGVRLLHSAQGMGWQMPEHAVNVTFPAVIVVPAGRVFGCIYTMPLVGAAELKCEVDSTAVTGEILR